MNSAHVLYHMVRADFLERVRRYSFLVTLAGALYLAYGVAAEKVWIVVGNGYRGVYNSAWIGMLMSVCCSTFLSLVGFYIVKNCGAARHRHPRRPDPRRHAHAQGFLHGRENAEQFRGACLHGDAPDAGRAGHATDARRSPLFLSLEALVPLHFACSSRHAI